MNRRGFLSAILASGVAPAFVPYGSLMVPRGKILLPEWGPRTWYVSGLAQAPLLARDGSSWLRAFASVPEVLGFARPGDLVKIAGTAVETSDFNRLQQARCNTHFDNCTIITRGDGSAGVTIIGDGLRAPARLLTRK